MPSTINLEPKPMPGSGPVRLPKVDFDQNGQKSSLHELLHLGGLFPLARIQDRLPFSRYRLGAMAKAWKGEPSEWLVCDQAKGRRMITLIHLDRFFDAFDAHLEAVTPSDLMPFGFLSDLEEGSEMLVLGEKLRGVEGLPAPA